MKRQTIFAIFASLLIFILFPGLGQATTSPLTLEETVVAGLSANPSVEAAHLVLEQTRLNILAARGAFLPTVSLESSLSNYRQSGDILTADQLDRNAFTNAIKISQPLFAGFAIVNNYAKTKLQAEVDKAKLDQSRLDLIYHIQQAFLQLLKTREDLTTVHEEIVRIQGQLEASKVFYQAGLSPYNEVLKNETDLSKAQADEIKVQNSIKNLTTQLNTFIAAQFDAKLEYQGDLRTYRFAVGYDEESAINTALIRRPELQIGKKSVELAKKAANETYAQYYPRVNLDYAKVNQNTDYQNHIPASATQNYDTVGVNMSWKIFTGGTTTYTHLGDLKRITAIEESLANAVADTKAAIVKAFTDIDDAQKLIALSLQTKESAGDNYRRATARYKTRIGTINDLMDAQYDLTQAESAISNAYMQYHLARASLFYNIGIENMGLE